MGYADATVDHCVNKRAPIDEVNLLSSRFRSGFLRATGELGVGNEEQRVIDASCAVAKGGYVTGTDIGGTTTVLNLHTNRYLGKRCGKGCGHVDISVTCSAGSADVQVSQPPEKLSHDFLELIG